MTLSLTTLCIGTVLVSFSSSAVGGEKGPTVRVQRTEIQVDRTGLEISQEYSTSALGGSQAFVTSGLDPLIWSVESDGTWLAQTASLGNDGTQVFHEHGQYQNHAQLYSAHDGNPATAVWSDEEYVDNSWRRVDSSKRAGVHISVHQELMAAQPSVRQAVLRKFSADGGQVGPDWTFESQVPIGAHGFTTGHVSADGGVICLLVFESGSVGTHLTVLDPATGTPLVETTLDTISGVHESELSSDGSTLVLASAIRRMIVDVTTGTVLHEQFTLSDPFYGALAISGNGALVAFGTLEKFILLQRDTVDGYSLAHERLLPSGTYCRRLALSEDGTVCVSGVHAFDDVNSMHLAAMRVDTGAVLMEKVLTGSGTYPNLVSDIQCSADGARFAVGAWGDEHGVSPEVVVFKTATGGLLLQENLPGSVYDLDFSPDGFSLAIAAKSVHATQWGGGGAVSLYRVPFAALRVHGIPRIGTSIEIEHSLRVGGSSRVLVATALAEEPVVDPTYGGGLFYLDPESIVADLPVVLAGSDNLASQSFHLSGEEAPVGSSLYLQAVDVHHGEMSGNWVRLTVLP
jgi:hypothetical protein